MCRRRSCAQMQSCALAGATSTPKHTQLPPHPTYLVEGHHHIACGHLPNHDALGGLRLDALGGINHQDHQVDNLLEGRQVNARAGQGGAGQCGGGWWAALREQAGWLAGWLAGRHQAAGRALAWAPPMIVRIRDAWPGQSTRVNCTWSNPAAAMWGGAGTCAMRQGRQQPGHLVQERQLFL